MCLAPGDPGRPGSPRHRRTASVPRPPGIPRMPRPDRRRFRGHRPSPLAAVDGPAIPAAGRDVGVSESGRPAPVGRIFDHSDGGYSYRDLAAEPVPHITHAVREALLDPLGDHGEPPEERALTEALTAELREATTLIIGVPMYVRDPPGTRHRRRASSCSSESPRVPADQVGRSAGGEPQFTPDGIAGVGSQVAGHLPPRNADAVVWTCSDPLRRLGIGSRGMSQRGLK